MKNGNKKRSGAFAYRSFSEEERKTCLIQI
jgi:hypothetical protein